MKSHAGTYPAWLFVVESMGTRTFFHGNIIRNPPHGTAAGRKASKAPGPNRQAKVPHHENGP